MTGISFYDRTFMYEQIAYKGLHVFFRIFVQLFFKKHKNMHLYTIFYIYAKLKYMHSVKYAFSCTNKNLSVSHKCSETDI